MAASFSLKLVLFQVLLACVCGAVMLGLRVRSESWHQDPSKQPVRVLRQASDCAHLSSPISRADCEEQPHSREILSPPKMGTSKRQAGAPSSAQQQQHSTDKKEQPSASNQPGTVTNPLATSSVPAEEVPSRHGHSQWLRAHKHGDLPMLSPDRSPDSDTWNNSVSICACMLQENTTDVREWLLYHRWLGVDHVYLTENSSPIPTHLSEQLQDFVDDGFLTLESDGKRANQLNIYKRCMEKYRQNHNWMAFIDIDEFIVIRKSNSSLKEFLDGFKHQAGVTIHWVLMGSSGQETRPERGGVLRHYQRCRKPPSDRVKTIANTWFLTNHAGQVHNFEYRDNIQAVDEHGLTMAPREEIPRSCTNGTVAVPSQDIHCRPVPAFRKAKDEPRSVDHIALYHYVLRSKEDFAIKMERGGGDSFKRDPGYFDRTDSTARGKGGICVEPAKLADECCSEDQFVLA